MPGRPSHEKDEGGRPPGGLEASRCFVCGPENPVGLHLRFRLEEGGCKSEFTPGEDHVGYPGVIHGGLLYSALDDVMVNWLYLQGIRGYTARCEIRYREPVGVGDWLLLSGRPTRIRRRAVQMEGVAVRAADGKVVAEASGTFMVVEGGERLATLAARRGEARIPGAGDGSKTGR